MPVRLTSVISDENKTVTDILLRDNINNNLTKNISTIKNNTLTLENQSHPPSSSWLINGLFNNIKYYFSKSPSSQSTSDMELNNILSQGRMLSKDVDPVHYSLNTKTDNMPSSSLSLTSKTGIALGSLLLTSAVVGGGIYYARRTSRAPHPDMPFNAQNSSLVSSDTQSRLNFYPVATLIPESTTTQDDSFRTSEFKKKKKRHNTFPCPYIHKNKNNKPTLAYTYTTNQPTICLTESFSQRCQKGHHQSKIGKNCHYIPSILILKIKGYPCLCPPPDWIAMKIIEPKTTSKVTQEKRPPATLSQNHVKSSTKIPLIKTPLLVVNNLPAIHSASHDEMARNQLSDSLAYIVLPQQSDTLPTEPPLTDSDRGEVERISLVGCADERENITSSKVLRIISQTMDSPVATTLKEGLVVIQYNFYDQKCADNTQIYEASKKVESTVESLLSWIPRLNKFYFVVKVVASLLETYCDALDGKDFNINNIEDINSRLLGLSKDVFSSIKTKDINKLSKTPDLKEIRNMIRFLKYKDNHLTINTVNNKEVKVQKKFNHFIDSESHNFIFYDHEKKWNIDNNEKLNSHIKDVFEVAEKKWQDKENIYFFKNSSPDFYGNGVIIRYHGELYILINDNFHKVDEINLTDNVFRYVIKDTNRPIIYKGERWDFEDRSSHSVSKELEGFLSDNHKIRNNLVSKNIGHQDVSPLTMSRDIQFDKDFNEYIKINNQYYRVKEYQDAGHYIEGIYDIMPLQLINNKHHLKNSFLDDICCFHREPLNTIQEVSDNNKFFLDNTVTSHLKPLYHTYNTKDKIIIKDISGNLVKDSPDIDGALLFDGINYIKYKDSFIQIHSNGDDTYILGDREDSNNNILVYKNQASNTYFKISSERKKWQGLIKKSLHCRVKKQPMSACAIDYIESQRISYILEKSSDHGIVIDDYENKLEPYSNFHAIYKKNDDKKNLYYKGKDNTFFYVRKNKENTSAFIPAMFVIYGKDTNQHIDLENVITSVSVIKDFDSKKIIFSTPAEAQENVFNINKKLSDLFLKWQEEDIIHKDITNDDLVKIKEKTPLLNDTPDLNELFNRSGKKLITNIKNTDKALKKELSNILHNDPTNIVDVMDFFDINNLQDLKKTNTHPVLEDICSNAFKKTINNIKDAISIIENSREKLNYYITNVLGISDARARDIFVMSLKSKLERMGIIFNEEHQDNIIIIAKKNSPEGQSGILSQSGETMIGFAIENDALDRIFINMAMITDFSKEEVSLPDNHHLEVEKIPQPNTPRRNRLYFINMIADTMLHEAIHVLGSPEDYLYLNTNKKGLLDNISKAIKKIESSIADNKMNDSKFEHLSKIYFMSNPLYKGFSIHSLSQPNILKEIFRDDAYFRAIVLLNNPDTISLLIRELANSGNLGEEEDPKAAVKEPAPSHK